MEVKFLLILLWIFCKRALGLHLSVIYSNKTPYGLAEFINKSLQDRNFEFVTFEAHWVKTLNDLNELMNSFKESCAIIDMSYSVSMTQLLNIYTKK